jgi:signal peptidase I
MRIFGLLLLGVVASVTLQAQTQTYQRGDVVQVRPPVKPSEPKVTPMKLIVVAVPNDTMRIDGKTILVNGAAVTGMSADLLAKVASTPERVPQTVPAGHYFVMGEERANQDITQYWGLHPAARLEPAK